MGGSINLCLLWGQNARFFRACLPERYCFSAKLFPNALGVFAAIVRGETKKKTTDLMAEVDFASDKKPVHDLLNRFIQTCRHLFCVQNSKGKFTGIVTLEDVLESLIGEEIVDEFDLHEDMQVLSQEKAKANL